MAEGSVGDCQKLKFINFSITNTIFKYSSVYTRKSGHFRVGGTGGRAYFEEKVVVVTVLNFNLLIPSHEKSLVLSNQHL